VRVRRSLKIQKRNGKEYLVWHFRVLLTLNSGGSMTWRLEEYWETTVPSKVPGSTLQVGKAWSDTSLLQYFA